MNTIIKNARTIQEKRKAYSKNKVIDYKVLDEWRDVRTLLTDKYFDEMLKENGMTKEEFAYSLQELEGESLAEDSWYDDFSRIIDSFDYTNIDYKVGVGLVSVPFTKFFSDEMNKAAKQLKNITMDKKIIESFITSQAYEMFNITGKLVAWKLALYKDSHIFESDNQEERLIEFLKNSFSTKESLYAFYEEYPVAARIATIRTKYLLSNYTELIERIDNDNEEIKKFLGINNLHLTEIKLSTGDSHDRGNSVSILNFEGIKLVYKPKDLRISEAFKRFTDWYVVASGLLDTKIPNGIYKENYSYNEFIKPEYCINEHQVDRFYTRYGYLIAICYLLNINDLHLENVVACGEYPVIIDIETLFQTTVELRDDSLFLELINKLNVNSVANSLLLPRQVSVGMNDVVDLSALNGRETKVNQKFLMPKNINTDDFHYEDAEGMFVGGNNIPKFNQTEEVNVSRYNMLIYEGFNDFISFVMNNKEECIKALDSFKDKKIRCLTKSTERYAAMIRYSNHPNYNTDMKYRERMLMNIWAYPYRDKRIVKSEVRDMLFNDIPIFFTYVNSRDLLDSQGEVYSDFHKKSGYELVVDKIERLSDKEIKLQQSILLLSLGILNPYLNSIATKREINDDIRKVDCLRQAIKISEKLMGEAYVREDGCSFINIEQDSNKGWHLSATNESIYGGLSGISIFYLELYKNTKDEQYYEYYKKLINTAIVQTKNTIFESAFTGWFSPIYPMILEYKYFGHVENIEFLEFTAKKLKDLKDEDLKNIKRTDFLTGIAGIVRLLAILHETFGDKYVSKKTIKKFSDTLKTRLGEEDKTLDKTGIAHGICGIMYGLISAGQIQPEYAKQMLHKEAVMGVKAKDTYKWCWGLSGLIQSRLAILNIEPKCIDIEELNNIISKFESGLKLMINNDTLCHGNGSIIVTLKMLYEYSQDNKWKNLLELWISNVNLNSLFDGYKIPRVESYYAKGIFDGYYGLGWMYLYASDSINNLLLLETK